MMYRLLTAAVLAASSVSAVSISSACQSALTGVAANSDANACLSVSSLLSTVLDSNASIITPVDNMLKALCSAAPCSNATLSAVVTNITTGCSAELSSSGSSVSAAEITTLVEQYYTTARSIICLTDSGTNCITETLTNIQSMLGTLSLDNIGTIITNAFTSTSSLPANVSCSNCVKGAYNILNQNFPSTASSIASELDSECGANFTDGSAPSGIVESATSTGGKDSGAMAVTRGALAGSVLLVASYLWVFLA
ncbi:hypothetical protein MSAN_00040600 [Mycena sanguinolenta]|uniref:Uncharacterized protein n=1 Tax=Mycena sanguinolenta TaxID=230812 RepID=A0A8H6ZC69_9AGAR|nr:hypothetical protein MSAN_00040600 [Mycena sanguinolenta]